MSSVITQEIHVVKRALSKTVRDLICQKVEETINNAPSSFTKEEWERFYKLRQRVFDLIGANDE